MIRFENSIVIDQPVDSVFTYLADLEHIPEWNWAITDSRRLSAGPLGTGDRYRLSRSAPQPGTEIVEVTGFEPGRWIELAGRLGPFDARLGYELARAASGTLVMNVVELEPPVPLGPVGGLLGGRIRDSVAANLGALKGVLERPVPSDADRSRGSR